jgi:hypothetical protein
MRSNRKVSVVGNAVFEGLRRVQGQVMGPRDSFFAQNAVPHATEYVQLKAKTRKIRSSVEQQLTYRKGE